MVLSCLVEPLVSPLTGRGTSGGPRRSALIGTRLAMTALAASALIAVSGAELRGERIVAPAKAERVVANAHKKPDAIAYQQLLETVFAAYVLRDEDDLVREPGLAASFEQAALGDHRLRDIRNMIRDSGPALGLGLRIDRLAGGSDATWLRFGSGRHLSGQPLRI
jgi:hypothetical protein